MSFFSRLFGDDKQDVIDKIVSEIRETPPCGAENFYQHYWWKEEGYACPVCRGIEQRKKEQAEEERKNKALAKAIADEFEQRGLKL